MLFISGLTLIVILYIRIWSNSYILIEYLPYLWFYIICFILTYLSIYIVTNWIIPFNIINCLFLISQVLLSSFLFLCLSNRIIAVYNRLWLDLTQIIDVFLFEYDLFEEPKVLTSLVTIPYTVFPNKTIFH